MNRIDWISFWADITPNKTAIIDSETEEEYSFQHIDKMACKTAAYLQDQYHLKKGDRVGIVSKNRIEYIYLFGAAQKIGITLVPLNYRLTSRELGVLLTDIEASFILYEDDFEESVSSFSNSYTIDSFFDNVSDSEGDFQSVEIGEDDAIFILYTSGSSGVPKGAIYTHKMLFWNSINTQISLKLDNASATIICMPPFHTGGWNVLLTPILHTGGTCILMEKFDAEKVIDQLEKYHCTIFMGVPTMLKMMYDLPSFKEAKFEAINYFIVGGEAMSSDLIEAYHEKGIFIRQGYGMTEVGPNLTSLHESEATRKIGSIGKPNMYVGIKVVDEEGNEVKQGERGELLLSGPNVTPGYFKKEEETKKCFSGSWFHTGDVVIQDEDGFIFIVDRIKNMFISGGENVYPAEVERTLLTHPSINEAVVIGVPDKKWGETGKAFIVLSEGAASISVDTLREFCLNKISKYKIPKYVEIIAEMPKNDAGKIDRLALKKG